MRRSILGPTASCDNVSVIEAAIPLAFTASWASGINPYLLVFLMGLLGRFTDFEIPLALERTDVLIVAGVLVVIDAVADKIMWLDSVWDGLNTAIRPIAGATVAVLIAQPAVDLPTAAIAASGGLVALITHLAKATIRLGVNTSPEPASNVAVSVTEDVAVTTVVIIALVNPWVAGAIAAVLLVGASVVALLVFSTARAALRARRRGRQRRSQQREQEGPRPSP